MITLRGGTRVKGQSVSENLESCCLTFLLSLLIYQAHESGAWVQMERKENMFMESQRAYTSLSMSYLHCSCLHTHENIWKYCMYTDTACTLQTMHTAKQLKMSLTQLINISNLISDITVLVFLLKVQCVVSSGENAELQPSEFPSLDKGEEAGAAAACASACAGAEPEEALAQPSPLPLVESIDEALAPDLIAGTPGSSSSVFQSALVFPSVTTFPLTPPLLYTCCLRTVMGFVSCFFHWY